MLIYANIKITHMEIHVIMPLEYIGFLSLITSYSPSLVYVYADSGANLSEEL